jgi:hypothetical protein
MSRRLNAVDEFRLEIAKPLIIKNWAKNIIAPSIGARVELQSTCRNKCRCFQVAGDADIDFG